MHFSKYKGFLRRKQWKFESASECCVSGSPVVAFFFVMQRVFRGPKLDKLLSGRGPNADVGVQCYFILGLTFSCVFGYGNVSII